LWWQGAGVAVGLLAVVVVGAAVILVFVEDLYAPHHRPRTGRS
jgi:hypothetical protein